MKISNFKKTGSYYTKKYDHRKIKRKRLYVEKYGKGSGYLYNFSKLNISLVSGMTLVFGEMVYDDAKRRYNEQKRAKKFITILRYR